MSDRPDFVHGPNLSQQRDFSASPPASIDGSPETATDTPSTLNGPLAANLGDGANGRLSEAEVERAFRAFKAGVARRGYIDKGPAVDGLRAALAAIVREHTERAWDEGWTRGAKDMNETVRWGETNCERPTNPYAARQEQDR